MKNIIITGRIFYGIGIAGIGILHFLYAGFRPVILPIAPESTQQLSAFVYITGALLTGAGLIIAAGFKTNVVALVLGIVLLLFVLAGHLPNRLINMPGMLGAWSDALKLLALSGGAFIIAGIYSNTSQAYLKRLNRLSLTGRYFFALMLLIFGIDHFVYADFVKTLVPMWMPGATFWTYFAGVALVGAGLALFINFNIKTISMFIAIMLFLWLVLLHIPRAVIMDTSKDPNEIVSVLECLAYCGMALLLSGYKNPDTTG